MSAILQACSIDLRLALGVLPRPISRVPMLAAAAPAVERCLLRQLEGRSHEPGDDFVRARVGTSLEILVHDDRFDVYDRRTGALLGLACRAEGVRPATTVQGPLDWALFFRLP
jgi:hypothetical protein